MERIQSFLKFGKAYLLLIEGLCNHVTLHSHIFTFTSTATVLCLQTRILINSILHDFHKKVRCTYGLYIVLLNLLL